MTTSQLDLARRLAESGRMRWMPGMRWLRLPTGAPDDEGDYGRHDDNMIRPGAGSLPDLSDPATVGCLLAQAREAWQNNGSATETTVGWRYYSTGGAIRGQGPSEGEAIAAAILGAP